MAGRRVWDPGLVDEVFLPWEAELIKRIPVSEGWVEDLLIWPLTPTGDYSVQSAYRMLEINARRLSPGTSSLEGQSKELYRAVRGGYVQRFRVSDGSVFNNFLRRNRLRENQPAWPLNEVGERAIGLVREFFEVGKSEVVTRGTAAPVRWSRPPDGFYKVNFDAALFGNLGCAGIRVAVRDSVGAIIAALSQRIPLPLSVEMAEAMAVRRAVLFVQELCLSKVLVEGDCLRVVSALNSSIWIGT
ncbi:hypothetical protein CFP56_008599 [Quercus suber]|uniref:RNase H type-1 domain-containing protein n=1 Tax=Quercus suber TaxID=58331 RepID=A0AAW0L5U6_QUESU